MRYAKAIGLAIALAGAVPANAQTTAPIVVELFTSQGCNSCPPADAFLAELAKRPGVLALSFHVDYWDYIGWKDPFAQRAFTERQRGYSRSLPLRYVYTPQMVVDGRLQDVGSDRKNVDQLIARAKGDAGKRLAMRLDGQGRLVLDGHEGASRDKPASVWLVAYDRVHSTRVTRGENAGRTLDNVNVVRRMDQLGQFTGEATTLAFNAGSGQPDQGRAVIVQRGDAGGILGVLALDSAPAR